MVDFPTNLTMVGTIVWLFLIYLAACYLPGRMGT